MTWLTNPYRFAPDPDVVLTARYWRWYVMARPKATQQSDISRIELALTNGGADLCLGLTSSASSATPGNAFDTNNNSSWVPDWTHLQGEWIQIDLGTPQTPVECRMRSSPVTPERTPHVFLLCSSNDGATWAPVCFLDYGYWSSAGEVRALPITLGTDWEDVEANARGWRITARSVVSGTEVDLGEIVFKPTYGGSGIASQSAYAMLSKGNPGVGIDGWAMQAFDLNNGNGCVSSGTIDPTHYSFVNPTPVGPMEEVAISPHGGAGKKMTAFDVYWTVDGRVWNLKKSFTGVTGWTNGTLKSFDLR